MGKIKGVISSFRLELENQGVGSSFRLEPNVRFCSTEPYKTRKRFILKKCYPNIFNTS
jgi:hypothetical protein